MLRFGDEVLQAREYAGYAKAQGRKSRTYEFVTGKDDGVVGVVDDH